MKYLSLTIILLTTILSVKSQQLVPFLLKNGRYSYVEYGKSNVVINSQYDEAKPFFEGYACVKLKNKWGVINLKGEIVIPIEHDLISNTKDGYTQVDEDLYNQNFEKLNFKFIAGFSNGYAIILEKDKLYIIDKLLNKTVLPIIFNPSPYNEFLFGENNDIELKKIYPYNGGFFRIECTDEFNYFNLSGKKILQKGYPKADDFKDGLAKVGNENDYDKDGIKLGFIDTLGNEVIPLRYNTLNDFSEDLAAAQIGTGFGFINKKGEISISFQGNYTASDFRFGLAQAFDNVYYKRFYINKQGKTIITTQNNYFINNSSFFDGLALFDLNDKYYGFIDTKGSIAIPPVYKYASNFNKGYALISKEFKSTNDPFKSLIGVINIKGVEVAPPKYEKIYLEFQNVEGHYNSNNINSPYRPLSLNDFERSCTKDLEIFSDFSNLTSPFFKNRIMKVELFGQKFYIDIEGHEYIEK